MHIAVIIPFRGASDTLLWALDGLRQQRLAPGQNLEVRICGDGSEVPPLPEPLVSLGGPSISFVGTQLEWSGVASAKNALLRDCPTDVVVFLNADTRPEPDFVSRHINRLQSLPPNWMVVGSSPYVQPKNPTVFDLFKEETPAVFFYNEMRSGELYDFRHAWGLNTSVRYADIARIGFFNDHLTPYGYEDLDLAYRVMGRQKQVYFDADAVVQHHHPMTLENYLDREEKLGLMMTVLAEANPELFRLLSGAQTLDEWTEDLQGWLHLDASMPEWIYRRLLEWVREPASIVGENVARGRTLRTLYQMHLPLKRWVFRKGALAGYALKNSSRGANKTDMWKSKIPSVWREALKDVLAETAS